ncbi:MAG: DUF896 domain-containing protein [Oscillospiraceae bacterium]
MPDKGGGSTYQHSILQPKKETVTMDEMIKRINELYKKSKEEGLSEEEQIEQKNLREQYVKTFRQGFKSQLNNIDVKYEDGETVPLTAFKKPKNHNM